VNKPSFTNLRLLVCFLRTNIGISFFYEIHVQCIIIVIIVAATTALVKCNDSKKTLIYTDCAADM